MTTFSVTTVPSQLYLGDQPEVTVYNEGPFTVYFEDNASVSVGNSFALPPFGQMSWKNDRPLWAVINSALDAAAVSRVKTSAAGNLSISTRSKTQELIWSAQPGIGFDAPILEVGQFATLYVKRTYNGFVLNNTVGGATYEQLTITWLDSQLNDVYYESYTANVLARNTLGNGVKTYPSLFRVPVRSRYVRISGGGPNDNGWYNGKHAVAIFGTDIESRAATWSSSLFWTPNATGFYGVVPNSDPTLTTNMIASNIGTTNSDLYIPSLGTKAQVMLNAVWSSQATDNLIAIIDVATGMTIKVFRWTYVSPTYVPVTFDILLPTRRAVLLRTFYNMASASGNFAITYDWDE